MDSTRKESQRKTGQAERIKGGAARLTLVAIAMYGFLNFSPISAQPKDLEDPNRGSALSIAELPGPSSEFQINQPVLQEEEQQQDGYIIRGQTLPLGGGSNVEIREIDGGLVNQIGETLNRQPGYEGAKIIVGEYGQTLNILSTNTRTGALEFTYPHAPADFNWNEENRVWVRQADGKTVVYIPGIALPGAWDNQAGIAGPAAIPEAAVLVQTPEGNLQMAVVYDRSSIEGHALERPPIAIEGTNFDIVMGAFKNIELEEGQRLENIINPLTNQIIGYKVVNQDGSYLRMITSWEGVERPEDVSNLFEARGIVNMNGEEIPYPSERIVTQDQLNDPNLNVEQIGDLYYISNVTESESVVLRVTTGGSRIRQEPNTQSTVVTTVEINSEIEYVGEIEGQAVNGETTWYIIEIDGIQYYIHSSLVNRETRSEVQTLNLAVGLARDGRFMGWFANEEELNSYLSEQGLVNADGIIIEDPRVTNPELFNLERPTSPIPQFVNAMRMAGIEVDPRGVVDNLRFRRIEGVNGEQFVIGSYTTTDSQNTPYTVAFIANRQENGWRWKRAYPREAEILGIKTGLSSWIEFTESWNPLSNLMPDIYRQFSINLIDGEAMWYIPYSPNSSLRPRRDNYNYLTLDQALNYNRMGIIVQSMIPSNSDFLPTWLKSEQNPEEVRRISLEHTQNVLSHIRTIAGDRVIAIGVASELTNNPHADRPNFWRQIFGITRLDNLSEDNYQWLVSLYQTAEDILPNAELYYSDFLIEFGGRKSEEVYNFVSTLRQRGAPIDAVAFQMHLQGRDFDSQDELNRNLEALRQQIRRYKQIGVNVIVSELDINMREVTGSSTYRNMIQSRAYYSIIRTLIEEEVDIISFFNPVDNQYNWLEQMNPNADPTLYNEVGLPKPSFYSTISALFQN